MGLYIADSTDLASLSADPFHCVDGGVNLPCFYTTHTQVTNAVQIARNADINVPGLPVLSERNSSPIISTTNTCSISLVILTPLYSLSYASSCTSI